MKYIFNIFLYTCLFVNFININIFAQNTTNIDTRNIGIYDFFIGQDLTDSLINIRNNNIKCSIHMSKNIKYKQIFDKLTTDLDLKNNEIIYDDDIYVVPQEVYLAMFSLNKQLNLGFDNYPSSAYSRYLYSNYPDLMDKIQQIIGIETYINGNKIYLAFLINRDVNIQPTLFLYLSL